MLLAAAEWTETLIELLATVTLIQRYPVPADIETQRAQIESIPIRRIPTVRKPRAETRYQVIGNIRERGSLQQIAQIRRDFDLTRMRPQCMHDFIERAQTTGKRIDGHGCGEIGGIAQFMHPFDRQRGARQHLRGAVVERETFLVRQPHALDTGPFQRNRTGYALATIKRFAAAEQHQRQMRQRRKVATGADRTQLRHHRHHAGVEHRGQCLQCGHSDAGVAAQQGVDADHQHRAHDLGRERLTDADRVGDDQVALQFLVQTDFVAILDAMRIAQSMRAEQPIGIATETGGHAVDRLLTAHLFGKKICRALHLRQLRRIEFDLRTAADRKHLHARQ